MPVYIVPKYLPDVLEVGLRLLVVLLMGSETSEAERSGIDNIK